MFDWVAFLSSRNIHYETRGPNVAHGNVTVHCPFCGPADSSTHMSISIEGHGWRCWRNHSHKGKNPVRLVQAILGCSWEVANATVGNSSYIPSDFLSNVNAKLATP